MVNIGVAMGNPFARGRSKNYIISNHRVIQAA
jgi:hypothetical protein